MAEANAETNNELTMLACGIYGHPLPKQHGAPLPLVVPWKLVSRASSQLSKLNFTAEQPRTFWNSNRSREYGFEANVDPTTPHPRWSQQSEKLIDTGKPQPTLPFKGYGEWVAALNS